MKSILAGSAFKKKIITNENGEPLFKEVTPSEGNALFCQGMEEIEDAFYSISMPINCDENELIEKEITNNKNIISVGSKSDVRPYLAISDVLVFPSYREGFPNVVLQAGAMELPCIVTNISGCNEIIEEGKNGIIIPPKNKLAIANAMNFVIENKDKKEFFRKNARSMIESRYNQKLVWNAILKEYNSLI